jgi:LmbE family N-acetylglucosaminyl deacetylase
MEREIISAETKLLDRLSVNGAPPGDAPKVVVIVAHPDDEIIGAGARLSRLKGVTVIHVTNGAPREPDYTLRTGFATGDEYRGARREECLSALGLAGVAPEQVRELDFADQEATFNLIPITRRLVEILREVRPEAVLTHSYEGGHPDHDATAFAVHTARRLLEGEFTRPPEVLELTSYYSRGGQMVTSDFLPFRGYGVRTVRLSKEERELKRRMFDCFVTQQEVLRWFPIGVERYRAAPPYDFTCPPHEGRLHYEYFSWGIKSARWRTLAHEALSRLQNKESALRASAHA